MDLVDELSQKWMPQNPSDDKSILFLAMVPSGIKPLTEPM